MKYNFITWTSYISKHFYFNTRIFDLSLKSNNLITKFEQMPTKIKISITLPLLPFNVDGLQKNKLIFNSLNLVSLFSKKKSILSKFWTIQKNKKRQVGAIISSKIISKNNFFLLPFFNLIIFPYIKISEGLNKFWLLSDTTGNLTFNFTEISYLSNRLNEYYIGWSKSIVVNLFFQKPKILHKLSKFEFINFKINRLIWSSLSFKCIRGHGGFITNSYVTKFYKNKKNNLSSKNYII